MFFTGADCDSTRSNVFKVNKERFRLDINMKFLTVRMMTHWNMLPRDDVDTPPQKCLRPGLMMLWEIWSNGRCPCPGSRVRTRWSSSPFQPKLSFNLMILSTLLRNIFAVSFLIPELATFYLTLTAVKCSLPHSVLPWWCSWDKKRR